MNAISRAIGAVMGGRAKDEDRRMRAEWNGVTLAESDKTVVVEGNHYFPPDALNPAFFDQSERRSVCPWKGTADYYDVVVDGMRNAAAAWTYPAPKPAAEGIKGHVAFWKGVQVSEAEPDGG
jgi:uncharacterized protein (DUF427 family)